LRATCEKAIFGSDKRSMMAHQLNGRTLTTQGAKAEVPYRPNHHHSTIKPSIGVEANFSW
jgi:hypothetical protein